MNISRIGSIQIDLLKKSKHFLTSQKKEGFNIDCHPSCYLSSWSKEYGNLVLKSFDKKITNMEKIYFNLKEIYKQFKFSDITIYKKDSLIKKYNKVVVTGSLTNDFKKNGYYFDRYFSMKAKDNKDTLWVVICHDKNMQIPKNFENNVIIIQNKSGHIISFFLVILKRFFLTFLRKKKESKLNFELIKEYAFETKLKNYVTDLFTYYPIKQLVLPYECQPFQNLLFKETKKLYPKISTIGYMHSMLTPLPSDFIKRDGSPDKVLVHGDDQKKILVKNLGWQKKQIYVVSSARYKKINKNRFLNKIVLPMTFEKADLLLEGFENFLKYSSDKTLPNLKIKNHPTTHNSQKHQMLIQEIKKLIKKYNHKFAKRSQSKKVSLFISVSAAIIEALELGMNVIQIFSEPVYETHNPRVWKNVKVNSIAANVFRYRLKNYKKYILFGKKNKNFKGWLKNFENL